MKRNRKLIILLALCGVLGLTGCRKRLPETEPETQTETETEKITEKTTEKVTEKVTEKKKVEKTTAETEKKTAATEKTTVQKTTVKPSTVNNTTETQTAATEPAWTETQQCPYCYQQISTAPNGDGTTVYSVHVAQEKAWADTYGYGDTPPVNQQTDAPQQTEAPVNTDIAQCGYCYQWFTVSDGSYSAHIAAENEALGLPQGTEYIQCPICGYSFPKGSLYDNHVCITN